MYLAQELGVGGRKWGRKMYNIKCARCEKWFGIGILMAHLEANDTTFKPPIRCPSCGHVFEGVLW